MFFTSTSKTLTVMSVILTSSFSAAQTLDPNFPSPTAPPAVQFPTLSFPAITLPTFAAPSFTLPSFSMPPQSTFAPPSQVGPTANPAWEPLIKKYNCPATTSDYQYFAAFSSTNVAINCTVAAEYYDTDKKFPECACRQVRDDLFCLTFCPALQKVVQEKAGTVCSKEDVALPGDGGSSGGAAGGAPGQKGGAGGLRLGAVGRGLIFGGVIGVGFALL
ncbi:hypothetical protein HDU97_000931 [Phlyctochytrium planicorne]|nr:hypothetical protein HDU97_000931 [Phlyctochytrium planicorne]